MTIPARTLCYRVVPCIPTVILLNPLTKFPISSSSTEAAGFGPYGFIGSDGLAAQLSPKAKPSATQCYAIAHGRSS